MTSDRKRRRSSTSSDDAVGRRLIGDVIGSAQDPSGAAAFLPDGHGVVIGGSDGSVLRASVTAGQPTWREPNAHSGTVQSVAASRDGRHAASGAEDGLVVIWDALDGRQLAKFRHRWGLNEIAFSHDGTLLAAACSDDSVHVWDVDRGERVWLLEGHEAWATGVDWSPNDSRVVSCSNDETIRLWDVVTGEQTTTREFDVKPMAVTWSRESNRIAVALSNGSVAITDDAGTEEVARFAVHSSDINCIEWSPDGLLLASGGDDQTVRVWDVEAAQEKARFDFDEPYVWRVSWSRDERSLAVSLAGGRVVLLDVNAGMA